MDPAAAFSFSVTLVCVIAAIVMGSQRYYGWALTNQFLAGLNLYLALINL